ncbi:MAG TPA: M23 family metallopeptidase [Rhizomicrobium sp.]|jgi:murein DD-endopeptidase MepM/ murein hydrolase activator NlpD
MGNGRAVLALLALISLSACVGDMSPDTELSWPVATYYTVVVRPGDSVSDIAQRYNVSSSEVLRMNELGARSAIHPGEILRIPPGNRATRVAVLRDASSNHVVVTPRDSKSPLPAAKPVRVARNDPPKPAPAYAAPRMSNNDSGLRFIWPVSGQIIDNFGSTTSGERNDGVNIAAAAGTPIRAAQSGTVSYAGNELRNYGNLVLIKHDDGYITAYAHADRISVAKGQHVEQGQIIGYAGTSGDVTRPQVHFEIRRDSRPVDPRGLLATTS